MTFVLLSIISKTIGIVRTFSSYSDTISSVSVLSAESYLPIVRTSATAPIHLLICKTGFIGFICILQTSIFSCDNCIVRNFISGSCISHSADGVPICRAGCRMRCDGVEIAKGRMKFKCPKMSKKNGCISYTCDNPCSDAKYGRTVHLVMNDNPRLFNNPPRNKKEWKLEYNAKTSAERSNKREKLDFKLENGKHRSTKM